MTRNPPTRSREYPESVPSKNFVSPAGNALIACTSRFRGSGASARMNPSAWGKTVIFLLIEAGDILAFSGARFVLAYCLRRGGIRQNLHRFDNCLHSLFGNEKSRNSAMIRNCYGFLVLQLFQQSRQVRLRFRRRHCRFHHKSI